MRKALQILLPFNHLTGMLLVIVWIASAAQSRDIQLFINSDTLYLPSIFLDLFVHGSGLEGWHLNASPNFFPDMITFIGLMGILQKTTLTYLVFSTLQFAVVMFLLDRVVKSWSPDTDLPSRLLLGVVVMLFLAAPVRGEDPLIGFQLLVPAYHCGFFINTLLVMITAMHYLRKGRIPWLVATGVLSFLAVLSDRIFLISFLFPMMVLVILSLLKNAREHRYPILFGVALVSSLLGMLLYRLLKAGNYIHFIGADWKMFNFANIGSSFRFLADYLFSIIREDPLQRWLIIGMLLFFLMASVYLVMHLRAFLKERLQGFRMHRFMLILFLLVQSLSLLLTPVINGSFLGPAHIRYNYPAVIMGATGAAYMLLLAMERHSFLQRMKRYLALTASAVLFIFLVLSGFRNHALKGAEDFISYYPERSQVLDKLKDPYGLTYGISNYWHAKHATIFSRNDVRVYSVFDEDLKPYYHLTNENWYHDGGKGRYADPVFNFIYADAGYHSAETLKAIFGERLDTIYAREGAFVIRLPPFKIDRSTRQFLLLDQEGSD